MLDRSRFFSGGNRTSANAPLTRVPSSLLMPTHRRWGPSDFPDLVVRPQSRRTDLASPSLAAPPAPPATLPTVAAAPSEYPSDSRLSELFSASIKPEDFDTSLQFFESRWVSVGGQRRRPEDEEIPARNAYAGGRRCEFSCLGLRSHETTTTNTQYSVPGLRRPGVSTGADECTGPCLSLASGSAEINVSATSFF